MLFCCPLPFRLRWAQHVREGIASLRLDLHIVMRDKIVWKIMLSGPPREIGKSLPYGKIIKDLAKIKVIATKVQEVTTRESVACKRHEAIAAWHVPLKRWQRPVILCLTEPGKHKSEENSKVGGCDRFTIATEKFWQIA